MKVNKSKGITNVDCRASLAGGSSQWPAQPVSASPGIAPRTLQRQRNIGTRTKQIHRTQHFYIFYFVLRLAHANTRIIDSISRYFAMGFRFTTLPENIFIDDFPSPYRNLKARRTFTM